jgi:hypothetical protein
MARRPGALSYSVADGKDLTEHGADGTVLRVQAALLFSVGWSSIGPRG